MRPTRAPISIEHRGVSDRRWPGPDFVGVGAARCATTWLARCLGEHPAIFIPRRKELHYFNNDFLYEPGLRYLKRQFAAAGPDKLCGEITPRYLIHPTAIRRIAAANPAARIIVCLRDPVERMLSQYCYFRFNLKKEPDPDFERAIEGPFHEDYVVKSLYAPPLENLLDCVAMRQVHVVLYDDVVARPRDVLERLFGFLGVDKTFAVTAVDQRINASGSGGSGHRAARPAWARLARHIALGRSMPVRLIRPLAIRAMRVCHPLIDAWSALHVDDGRPSLDPAIKHRLLDRYFREDIERTAGLLGLDLVAWKGEPAAAVA